jgi:hypothetical protein
MNKLARMLSFVVTIASAAALSSRAQAQDQEPQARAPREPSRGEISAALARYSYEPTVDRVVAAAVRVAEVLPERARDAAHRARLSGWLPTARVGVRRGTGRDLALQSTDLLDRTNISTDDTLAVEGVLVFRLDRLVFAREEVALLREEQTLAEERDSLMRDVVHLYFERRRLQLERDLLGQADTEHAVRIAEATALLDAFTRGAFSSAITTRRARRAND